MPLNDAECRSAKGKDKPYKLTDGEGMFLLVQPNGSRLWRLAYRFDGKQKTLAFGIYPYVTLAAARQKRLEAKTAIGTGKDPAAKEDEPSETFESVARRWFKNKEKRLAKSYSGRLLSRLEDDVFPSIGSRPVNLVEPKEILTMLRRVEDRGAIETAKRLKQCVGSIFDFAIAEGNAKLNPAASVGAALQPNKKKRHHPTIKPAEVPELLRRIDTYDGEYLTRIALKFVLHTFVRTGEIRFARWREIEGDVWRIPEERMKMGREHLVPLTPAALALLELARPFAEGDYIFPGVTGKPMSENTLLYSLYRLGYHSRLTVHGFRGLASTVLNEVGFPSDHIEMQLAHNEEDKIRGAYNSAEYLPGRRKMMGWWSDWLGKCSDPSADITLTPADGDTPDRYRSGELAG
jgi:integrase